MKKLKEKRGITLIALVITIIVLLILAGVTIATLTGDNGILQKTSDAKQKSLETEIEEQIKLAYLECEMEKFYNLNLDEEEFLKNRLKSIFNLQDNEILVEVDTEIVTVSMNGKDYTYTISDGKVESATAVSRIKKSTAIADSYVGCYADIDKDGIVDGVIFADLLTGSVKETQKWGHFNEEYELPTNVTTINVNTYYISQESYKWAKTTTPKPVISPKTTSGEKRFYIMALLNFTTPAYTDEKDSTKDYPEYTSYYWYKNAHNMSPLITLNNFGEGKENTRKMIEKWNAAGTTNGYTNAAQDSQDIWKHIQTKNKEGWFLPSSAEWAAFLNELGINYSNYSSIYELDNYYWTSTQISQNRVNLLRCNYSLRSDYNSVNPFAVRLATTF